jgi:bifunctional DNase/RNase
MTTSEGTGLGAMELEMKIKGLMIDPITNMPIIILRDPGSSAVLPIWVGIFEANAIALQIEKIATPRPMTHDLLKSILVNMQASVEKVVITDLKENTFYALIILRHDGRTVTIDSRPSDAIALALRTGSPIFVNSEVIEKARNTDLTKDAGESERIRKWLENLDPDEMGKYEM